MKELVYNLHNGKNKIFVIKNKNIIISIGIGEPNEREVLESKDKVKEIASSFKGKWYFLGDLTRLPTLKDPKIAGEFVKFHEEFYKMNCVAFAMVANLDNIGIKIQSKKNHNVSGVKELQIEYFRSEEDALDWIDKISSKSIDNTTMNRT
jgi:hypothetical protein